MIQAPERRLLPADFTVTNWQALEPYYHLLTGRTPASATELEQWLQDWSELEAVVAEDACWRQIRMTCDTTDPALEEAFNDYCLEIEPRIKPFTNELQQKLAASPFVQELDPSLYFPFLRGVDNALHLFREANIPIQAELNVLAQQYGAIAGNMAISVDGKEYTLQQALRFLERRSRSCAGTYSSGYRSAGYRIKISWMP